MNQTKTTQQPQVGGDELSDELYTDTDLLNFLDTHKQYVVGFAPSGDWSAFHVKNRKTCYGKTLRDCLIMLQVMHADIGV